MSACVYCGRDCFCDDVCQDCYRELEAEQRRQESARVDAGKAEET